MKNALMALVLVWSGSVFAAENRAPASGYCTDSQGQIAIRVFRVADQLMAAWAFTDPKVAVFQHTLEVSYSVSVPGLVAMTFSSDSTREEGEMELYFQVGPFGRGTVRSTFFPENLARQGMRINCSFQYGSGTPGRSYL